MKVDNPEFDINAGGEVARCDQCPFDPGTVFDCRKWWRRNNQDPYSPSPDLTCPTAETYAEACELASKTEATREES